MNGEELKAARERLQAVANSDCPPQVYDDRMPEMAFANDLRHVLAELDRRSSPTPTEDVAGLVERLEEAGRDLESAWFAEPPQTPTLNCALPAYLREAASALRSLHAEREAMRGALGPFAEAAANLDGTEPDDANLWESPEAMMLTAGDLRRARRTFSCLEGQ